MTPLANNVATPVSGPEARKIARTSILVAATLRVGSQAVAVRIRNMSSNGALIEGSMLPLVHTPVELVRGELRVSGKVAWVDGNRCGVALDEPIAVDCWISGKPSLHQSLVDGMVTKARRAIASAPPAAADPSAPEPPSGIGQLNVATTTEIDSIITALAGLGERLADDPDVVATHLVQLQALDEAQQRLAALKRRLA